jgi:hypothetical protein
MVRQNSRSTLYNDSAAYISEEEYVPVIEKSQLSNKSTKALMVTSALLFGAALIFTLSAMSFGTSGGKLYNESSSSEFDSKGR